MFFRGTMHGASLTLAIAIALVAGGCATSRSPAQRDADRDVAAQVSSALNADARIYAKHIDVRATNGVVRLGGYVWSNEDLERAKDIAATVPGVKGVVNNMELERGGIDNSPVSR